MVYVICVESSKTRGMGHFFRSLLYADYLNTIGRSYIILINNDEHAVEIYKKRGIPYRIVDYCDNSDWETEIIKEFGADVWLQDKFETSMQMAQNITRNKVLFCAIDEFGPGAELCDIHFAGMIYLTGHKVDGKRVYCGTKYVVLNPEIEKYRRIRTSVSRVVISLGGSDPYGMTVEIVKQISKTELNVSVIIGPDFDYYSQLVSANVNGYPILKNVPSLIEEFFKYDFAITGGGITCCEANSCGLPCIIIANAVHEIRTGYYMQKMGGAIYGGSFQEWNKEILKNITDIDIMKMSRAGMGNFDAKAINRIFTIIDKEHSYNS